LRRAFCLRVSRLYWTVTSHRLPEQVCRLMSSGREQGHVAPCSRRIRGRAGLGMGRFVRPTLSGSRWPPSDRTLPSCRLGRRLKVDIVSEVPRSYSRASMLGFAFYEKPAAVTIRWLSLLRLKRDGANLPTFLYTTKFGLWVLNFKYNFSSSLFIFVWY